MTIADISSLPTAQKTPGPSRSFPSFPCLKLDRTSTVSRLSTTFRRDERTCCSSAKRQVDEAVRSVLSAVSRPSFVAMSN
jgi:hypothetical protein